MRNEAYADIILFEIGKRKRERGAGVKNAEAVWVVIHMAHSEQKAENARALLTREGFMVRIRPVARTLSGERCFEIQAIKAEAKEAREVLQENGL